MRPVFLLSGLLLLLGLWWGPLADLAERAFYAHMIVHMGVVAFVAPLLAFSFAGGPFDPARKWPRVFSPIPASMVEFVFVWAWHAPALHHAARHSCVGLITEQATFLLSGLLLWFSVLGGDSEQRSQRAAAGVIGLLLTAMHMTLLGALIALAPRPLYSHANSLADLSPLQDQHLGGAVMIAMGGATYLAGGLYLMRELLKKPSFPPGVPQ